MAVIDLRDQHTQRMYAALGEAGVGSARYWLDPREQQIRSILDVQRNQQQLDLLYNAVSQIQDQAAREQFLQKNAPLFERLGAPLPSMETSDVSTPTTVSSKAQSVLGDIAAGSRHVLDPGVEKMLASEVPGVVGSTFGMPSLPLKYSQAPSDIKKKLGKKEEESVRIGDVTGLGLDLDTLFRSPGQNVLAMAVGVPTKDIQSLGLDPTTTTFQVYQSARQFAQQEKKFNEDVKQFSVVQNRIRDLFGENTQKQAGIALANLQFKLGDKNTTSEERELILASINQLAELSRQPGFKKVPKEGLMPSLVRLLSFGSVDPTEIQRAIAADETSKKAGGGQITLPSGKKVTIKGKSK